MRTSLEWADELDRRVWRKLGLHPGLSDPVSVIQTITAEVIREAMNEAREEVIQAMRHVETLTPGHVQTMVEGI